MIAESNGRREVGSGGGGGRFGLGYFQDAQLERYVDQAVNAALTNLESRPAPAGEMSVVLGPGWPGVLLHEAVGHGLEGDFNRKGSSTFSGRIGHRVAAKGVTVVERHIKPEELPDFSECFLTGSAAEVTPVSEIGPYKFTPGQITKTLMEDFTALVQPTAHAMAANA